jgi:hypothetical protein
LHKFAQICINLQQATHAKQTSPCFSSTPLIRYLYLLRDLALGDSVRRFFDLRLFVHFVTFCSKFTVSRPSNRKSKIATTHLYVVYDHASPGRGSSRLIALHRGSDMCNSSPRTPQDTPNSRRRSNRPPDHIEKVENLWFAQFCRFLHLTTHAKQPGRCVGTITRAEGCRRFRKPTVTYRHLLGSLGLLRDLALGDSARRCFDLRLFVHFVTFCSKFTVPRHSNRKSK